MQIAVLIKEVPDTYGERFLSLETGLAQRDESDAVVDEIDERALEAAMVYADANPGTEVTLITMAPAAATASIRKGLAFGASGAVHIVDDALAGADVVLTAHALAAAARFVDADLIIGGDQSTDGVGGVVPSMLAEILSVPALTNVVSLSITADAVSGDRLANDTLTRISAALPAVVSVTEKMPAGRFPSFKGMAAAKKKLVRTLKLTDLGVDADSIGARSIMLSVARRPTRAAGAKIIDDGSAAQAIADYLEERQFV